MPLAIISGYKTKGKMSDDESSNSNSESDSEAIQQTTSPSRESTPNSKYIYAYGLYLSKNHLLTYQKQILDSRDSLLLMLEKEFEKHGLKLIKAATGNYVVCAHYYEIKDSLMYVSNEPKFDEYMKLLYIHNNIPLDPTKRLEYKKEIREIQENIHRSQVRGMIVQIS
jgi:hypothetical protein